MKVIPIIGNDNSFLYRFLVSSRFRVARHITVIVALLVIACNLVLFSCQGYIEMLGKWTYLLIFNMFLLYGSIFYFNLLYLVPRYLLKQRYLTYILSLSTALIVVFIFQATQEYIVSDIFSVPNIYVGYSKVAFVMDYLSSFPLTLLSIMGGGMTVLLRLWILENQRVMQLEKIRLQSEIEHLKEQISPSMLFRVLHYSSCCRGRHCGRAAAPPGDQLSAAGGYDRLGRGDHPHAGRTAGDRDQVCGLHCPARPDDPGRGPARKDPDPR